MLIRGTVSNILAFKEVFTLKKGEEREVDVKQNTNPNIVLLHISSFGQDSRLRTFLRPL